jgi:hypothetical protein
MAATYDGKVCKEFDDKLKTLFKAIIAATTGIKSSKYIKEFNTQLCKAMSASTTFGIIIIGKEIIKACETEIKNGDEKWFLSKDYSKGLIEFSTRFEFPYKDAAEVILKIKETYSNMNAAGKKSIVTMIQDLLSIYNKL